VIDPVADAAFGRALRFTLAYEGGYVNHPKDPGGATMKGITQATYNAWRRTRALAYRAVAYIRSEEVEEIYRRRYWQAVEGDTIASISEDLAVALFDFAVNSGPARAVKCLQRSALVTADGVIGPKTIVALCDAVKKDRRQFLRSFIATRENYMRSLKRGRMWKTFGRGWLARLNALRREVGV
jgi:lysozyme family protein